MGSKELTGWKRFNLFSSILLIMYFVSIFLFSNNYLLREIIFSSYYPINDEITHEFIGESIHLVSTDHIIDKYMEDENIQRVTVNKAYPYTLEINIDQYQTLALIVDYRTESPIYYKLYKNGKAAMVPPNEISLFRSNKNSIKIINGPLKENVYGEFVNYFLLLRDTDSSIETSFILESDNLIGKIDDFSIDFISPENLGKKASAVYQRLQKPCPSLNFTVDIDHITGNVIVICNT